MLSFLCLVFFLLIFGEGASEHHEININVSDWSESDVDRPLIVFLLLFCLV